MPMHGLSKLLKNQEAQIHLLKEEDSRRLKRIFENLKTELEWIMKRDSLPIDAWYPSEDFKCLIRQVKKQE